MPNVFLSEDYLVRLISQALAALAAIYRLKASQQFKEAAQQADEALESQFGLRASLLKELDDERLKEMLTTNGTLEMERFVLVADLFKESAELAQRRGDTGSSRRDGLRALNFYLEALLAGWMDEELTLPAKVDALVSTLQDAPLPAETRSLLTDYYRVLGSAEPGGQDSSAMSSETSSDVSSNEAGVVGGGKDPGAVPPRSMGVQRRGIKRRGG